MLTRTNSTLISIIRHPPELTVSSSLRIAVPEVNANASPYITNAYQRLSRFRPQQPPRKVLPGCCAHATTPPLAARRCPRQPAPAPHLQHRPAAPPAAPAR